MKTIILRRTLERKNDKMRWCFGHCALVGSWCMITVLLAGFVAAARHWSHKPSMRNYPGSTYTKNVEKWLQPEGCWEFPIFSMSKVDHALKRGSGLEMLRQSQAAIRFTAKRGNQMPLIVFKIFHYIRVRQLRS
jgi:hypothetical protein